MEENRREHFRIFYPLNGHVPQFECEFGRFPIMDVSEGGFRFSVPKKLKFYFFEYDKVEGRLVFPNARGSHVVRGDVVRAHDHKVAVKLHVQSHIPLNRIMEEQRILIRLGVLQSAS